ncbi:MAG: pyridoxal-phosphate dependent enzyme [Sandaracinaceae bacterium]
MSLTINPSLSRVVDSLTGEEVDPGGFARPLGLSPHSGKPLWLEYDLDRVADALDDGSLGRAPGLRRFAPLLPVQGFAEGYVDDVGRTPIVRSAALSARAGVDVHLKLEGTNPTGSFKDRGLSIGVALGVACGARRFALPTQGNAGVAAAFFSARMGLPPALVYMPDGYQRGIYHHACAAFGGEVRFFGPNIAAAGGRMREDLAPELARGEIVDLSTFFEPGRLEGKKTMGLEIAEHFADDLPDWILYPTGGGTGLVGIGKAFAELQALGRIAAARLPRMVAVQSERCAPVVRAFEHGLAAVEPVTSQGTVADGLDVPGAIMGHRMLALLRDSEGTAVAVTEDGIRDAFRDLGRTGVPAGYESAALWAALQALRERGDIAEGERVLLVVTSGPMVGLAHAVGAG